MKKNIKLSIITICYNIKDEIKRTCESIVNQSWQNFEWIVVDGGSTDGTLDILKEYKDRINILISEPDKGIYNAMNKGIRKASGKWLNFMNGGDCFASNNVLEQVFKNKNYKADVLYGNINIIENDKISYKRTFPKNIDKIYFYNNWISHQASFIKKMMFDKYNSYDESLKIVSDWEKWLNFVSHKARFLHLPLLIANFYLGGISNNKKNNKIHFYERADVINRYFTKEDINKVYIDVKNKSTKIIYNLFNFIPFFSKKCFFAKKIQANGVIETTEKYKIKIFGIPFLSNFNVKTKYDIGLKNFIPHEIQKPSVLLVEMNGCHGECLPGMVKYFLDLKYNVDIFISASEYQLKPLHYIENIMIDTCLEILQSPIINNYEHIYFNSDMLYIKSCSTYDKFIKHLNFNSGKIIMLNHHAENLYKYSKKNLVNITLANFPILNNIKNNVINPHYFGKFPIHEKNKKTKFIVVGNIESTRKNHSLLFDAINELLEKNITDFEVDIIARKGNLQIPNNISPYINFKGRLSYPDMYKECVSADFFLTLLDPTNKEHERYTKSGSSGSYQLIYGFNIPCIINEYFLNNINLFNKSNSLVYKTNKDLSKIMEKAITMSSKEYTKKLQNLIELQRIIYKNSLQNLKNILQ